MKTILSATCLLIAFVTASHADVGRYQTTNITSSEYPGRTWVVTDTLLGKFRYCDWFDGGIMCEPWFDVQNDDWKPRSDQK